MPLAPTAQPLSHDEAYAVLMQRVYVPAFIEKLAADHNVRITTDEQLQEALLRASQLRSLHDQSVEEKQASEQDELSHFGQYLDAAITSAGQPNTDTARLIKAAAARGAQDPELARAVLSLAAPQAS